MTEIIEFSSLVWQNKKTGFVKIRIYKGNAIHAF